MKNDKLVFRIVLALSIVVLAAVIILNRKILPVPEAIPTFVFKLPMLNAFINATCSILLLFSLWAIKRKNIQLHKRINLTAFALSSVFLVSYITYHWMATETKYPESAMRPVYLFILVSHIILAAIVLPMILMSFYFGLKNDVVKHRKLVRFSYPIWLYVTITGVVVYLMISPFYPF
jgi:putative membrane protein